MTEILILDYNRPNELKNLLNSLKENALFEKKIVREIYVPGKILNLVVK